MASITLNNVGKVYPGGTRAVENVNIDIADGEFIVLVGPSGCGKSTLLRMVAGLEEITEGEVKIGERIVNQVEPAERDIAMVFQNYALYPHVSPENLEYGLKNCRTPRAEIDRCVNEAAEIPQIGPFLDCSCALSGGQRQRGEGPRDRARTGGVPVRRTAVQSRREAAGGDAARDQGAAETPARPALCHP